MNVEPLTASPAGWCAPAETTRVDPPPAVTWLVDLADLAAMTDDDRAWLDAQWALAGGGPQ